MQKLLFWIPLCLHATPDYFSVGAGVFDIPRERHRAMELDLEYKFHLKAFGSPWDCLEFLPLVGVMGNAGGSGFLYLGLNFDFLFFDHLLISPGFAGGYYWQGRGKNLGFPIEFRSGIELGWQFSGCRRLGVHFYHLSNASLSNKNPGEESLILFYDIPIENKFPFSN